MMKPLDHARLRPRAAGLPRERKSSVRIGVDIAALLFRRPRRIGAVAREALEYFQPPYIAVHTD